MHDIEKFEKVLNTEKVDWHNLLEQFLQISTANFAIFFSSENLKKENNNF